MNIEQEINYLREHLNDIENRLTPAFDNSVQQRSTAEASPVQLEVYKSPEEVRKIIDKLRAEITYLRNKLNTLIDASKKAKGKQQDPFSEAKTKKN